MSAIYSAGLGAPSKPLTMWPQRKARVAFDEEAMPYDASTAGGAQGAPLLVDMDEFEDMLIAGKFITKSEAVTYCRNVYTLLFDADDENTHWTDSSWRRIRDGLFPEALAAFIALPHSDVMARVDRAAMINSKSNAPGSLLLKAGQCIHGHKIKGPEDLASTGCDEKGNPRLGCIHCRRDRSRARRAKNKKEAEARKP